MSEPCYWTGDHHWRHGGGACSACGYRLRCICGRFVTVDGIDAHLRTCPSLAGARMADLAQEDV